jgi:Cdc6-like AAA superfamily ATPase
LSAGFAADRKGQPAVLPEHVREAQEKTEPKIRDEDVTMLSDDEKLVLLALARHLKRDKEAIFLPLEEVETSYHVVCEEYGVEPVGRVMPYALVKQLKAAGLITLNEKFEPGLNGVKAEVLEKFLVDLLKGKEFDA